jgi:EmrB/QacA subfamily drug resistance transporter
VIVDLSDTSNISVQRLIIGTVSLASLMSAIDMSAVNISIPAIVKDWQIPIGQGSLVLISYLLTLTVLILVMGKLADRYGFRRLFLLGFTIFGIGSILCALSPCIPILVFSRIVQAAGASMLTAVSPAIITRYLPPETRGKSLGYLIAVTAVGYALGPGLGGLLTAYPGWRWIFILNVPVVLVGLVLGYHLIPRDPPAGAPARIDLPGACLFIAFLGCILASLSFLQVAGTPDSVLLGLFLAGTASGIWLCIRDRKSPDPLIFTPLLKDRNILLGLVTCFIVSALFSGVTYLMPLYLVNSRHLDQFFAGMIMTIPALISMVAAPISGNLADRHGSPRVSAIAIAFSGLGFILMFMFNPTTAVAVIVLTLVITRVSTASFFGPNGLLIMGHCPEGTVGTGSGLMMTVRYTGLVCGIALFQNVFAIREYLLGVARDGTPLVPRLTPAMSVLGYQAVYMVAFTLCMIVVVLSLITRDAPGSGDGNETDSGPLI